MGKEDRKERRENRQERKLAKIQAKTERTEIRQESENILAEKGVVEKAWIGDTVQSLGQSASSALSNIYGRGNKPGSPAGGFNQEGGGMMMVVALLAALFFLPKLLKG